MQMGMEPVEPEPEPQRFATYVALGRAIKRRNPGITYDDEKVGRAVANQGGYIVEEDPHWANQVMSAIAEPFEAISGASESLFGAGYDLTRQTGMGVTSGATLGASEYAVDAIDRAMGNPGLSDRDQKSMAYNAGELIGEIAGPYKTARGLFGKKLMGTSKTWGRRLLAGSAEAGAVEGGKAIFDSEKNVLSSAAVGFFVGGLGEGAVSGVVGAGRYGIDKLIKPGAGEKIATRVVDWLRERDLPVVPTIARPFSNVTAYVQEKATRSAAAMARVKHVQKQLHEGLSRAKETFINQVGGNAGTVSSLDAGRALYHRVTGVGAELRLRTRQHYDKLSESEIGTVEIDPNMKYGRLLEDGSVDETDLWTSLRSAMDGKTGGVNLTEGKKAPSGTPPPLKLLKSFWDEAREKHTMQTRTVRGETTPGPMTHTREGADDFQTIYQTESGPASQWSREEEFLPRQDYTYWWGMVKRIGSLMDTSQYKKNKSVKRQVDAAYHAVQDAIDFQASRLDPNYETSITAAREVAKASFEYADAPLVQKILAAPEKYRSEEMIDALFFNTETMQAAKRALGPADFEQSRQAYLRRVMDGTIEMGDADLGDVPAFRKLWAQLTKKGPNQMDSPFMRELFSDDGFVDPITGKTVQGVGGEEKRALMVEWYEQFRAIDAMLGDLTTAGEAFGGAGTERGGLASFVDPSDLAGSLDKMKRLAFQLVSTARLADEYFKPPDENIFIYKTIPSWEGNVNAARLGKMGEAVMDALGVIDKTTGWPVQLPSQISSSTRQAATSAALNRILPSD